LTDRARPRILHRVIDDLPECLFEQDWIDVDEGQFARDIQCDTVPGEQALSPVDRRIDDIRRLHPLGLQPNAFAGDQRRVEQILHVAVESIDLVAQNIGKRGEPRVAAVARRPADHRRRTEDRDQRRAQLVRDRTDKCVAQRLGLRAYPRLADGLAKI